MSGFPSSSGSVSLTLDSAWQAARSVASLVKQVASNMAAACQAGNVSASPIVIFPGQLQQYAAQLAGYAAVPGMAAYAQAQVGNPGLDVVAAFNAMQSAITGVAAWVVANFPKDASNNLLFAKFDANGNLVYTTFTPAQLTGFVTQLQALIATID